MFIILEYLNKIVFDLFPLLNRTFLLHACITIPQELVLAVSM